ncbi:MAG TPA: hypothetical protein VK472_07655 [Allosphingosinicella sp.]|nr:hypothetical protein [Allosphingosinicella sp.]
MRDEDANGKAPRLTAGAAVCALLFAPPASAALPAAAPVAAPVAAREGAPDCAAVAAERTALEAEHRAVRLAISDIAMGRNRPRRKASAGDVGRAAAGTLASLLLPFGLGIAANAAGAAASKSGKKKKKGEARPPEPEPDVQALIARQQDVEARLRELGASACPQVSDGNMP